MILEIRIDQGSGVSGEPITDSAIVAVCERHS
jgi:hypothetical protein